MNRQQFRLFVAASGIASAMVLLGGCDQQPPGEQLALAGNSAALTTAEVMPTGGACTPTGAHAKHMTIPGVTCTTCHACAGALQFEPYPNGLAVMAGGPAPSFDATTKTCSNVACHSVPTGTFSYYFPDGTGEPALITVSYYGVAARATPSWYATGAGGCTACHDDPPRNGSTGSNVWHSGYHGGQGPTGPRNQCQFCHPDASSPGNGIGDTITNASLHRNGAVNVQATFTSACFGCH